MLKISVAMTSYNGEKFIKTQLSSLLKQIRKPDEVIIVDDVSTDNTVEIIKDFITENKLYDWKLTVNEENLGFKQNFKKALSLATGDIVFLCDQDDCWCEDKIESISSIFYTNPDILAVNSSFTVIDGDGVEDDKTYKRGKNNYGLIDVTLKKQLTKIKLSTVIHCNISPGCTMAVRRELIGEYVKNTECLLPHDYELNIMAAAKNSLYFYDAPLIKYRIHSGNAIGLEIKPQSRTLIATEKLAGARVVYACTGNGGLVKLCGERLRSLTTLSLFGILKLWLFKDYYKYFPFRERVGDILYIFGRR